MSISAPVSRFVFRMFFPMERRARENGREQLQGIAHVGGDRYGMTNNKLKDQYDRFYRESTSCISKNNVTVDLRIGDPTDTRYGISLLIYPPDRVKQVIRQFLQALGNSEPEQYYYPGSDIHSTIMSIISCYGGFTLDKIDIRNYVKVIEDCISMIPPFLISYRGVTLSPSCIMIQGFASHTYLDMVRNNLRNAFRKSGLEHTIDKRYAIATIHATVVRFRKLVADVGLLLTQLKEHRDTDFGTFLVDRMVLVGNDWYQQDVNVKLLHEFELSTRA